MWFKGREMPGYQHHSPVPGCSEAFKGEPLGYKSYVFASEFFYMILPLPTPPPPHHSYFLLTWLSVSL